MRLQSKDDEIESLHQRLGERMTALSDALERAETAEHARRESVVAAVPDVADERLMELQMQLSDLHLSLDAKDSEIAKLKMEATQVKPGSGASASSVRSAGKSPSTVKALKVRGACLGVALRANVVWSGVLLTRVV